MPHRPTAYPGFAVYHEGPDLVAVVSTGVEVWHLSVTGIIMNRTWVNIGITWMKPNFEDASLPVEKLGGLEMYINQEKVGRYTYYIAGMILLVFPGRQQTHVLAPSCQSSLTIVNRDATLQSSSLVLDHLFRQTPFKYPTFINFSTIISEFRVLRTTFETFFPVTNYTIGGKPPPVMTIGCHFDYDRGIFGGFSGGEYDELALWNRKLDSDVAHDETVYFLSGAPTQGYANVTPDQESNFGIRKQFQR